MDEAIQAFNAGDFYRCHDILEALWHDADFDARSFYQGLLQIAVACYHFRQNNWNGAKLLLGEGSYRLRRYAPVYASLDLDQLLEETDRLLLHLQQASGEYPFPLPQICQHNPD